jgi:hypothetical protein
MSRGNNIFLLSLACALAFKLIQISFGITNGFHPDSYFYLENYQEYSSSGLLSQNVFNNFYYFIVGWTGANETILIFLNQLSFALTNVLIARSFQYDFSRIGFIGLFVMFLPYRLHLSAHVLKDTLIIFAVILTFTLPAKSALLASVFTAALRNVAGPAVLLVRYLPVGRLYFVGFVTVFILLITFSSTIFDVLAHRGDVDMFGRDLVDVPLSNTASFGSLIAKIFFWPLLAKTGAFAIFGLNPFVIILALEPFVFFIWTIKNKLILNFLTANGMMIIMVFCSLVTNYGAYHRYIYAFVILDYVIVLLASQYTRYNK